MTQTEALRLALEALEYFSDTSPNMAGKAHAEDAITAIKAALEAKDEHEQLRDENERLHVENRRLIDRIETIGVPVGVGGFATTTSQEAKDEPVAWMHVQGNHEEPSLRQLDDWEIQNGWKQYPLYTTPPQCTWDELTEAECGVLWKVGMTPFDYYQAIEAKLKEKNNG